MSALRWLAALAGAVLALVAGDVISEEIRARLDRLPFVLLRLARARLPAELRERVHDQEWVPELQHILQHAELFPVTRLMTGIRYAVGLVMRAGTVGAELLPGGNSKSPAGSGRAARPGMARRSAAVFRLLIWPEQEPLRVRLYLAAVTAAAAAAIATTAASTTVHRRDLEVFLILVACGLIARRSLMVADAPLSVEMTGIWILPMAILLPAVYALIASVPFIALDQWRRRCRKNAYRRVFCLSINALAFGAASELAHTLAPPRPGHVLPPGTSPVTWVLVIAACGMLAWATTTAFVGAAVKGSAPDTRVLPLLVDKAAVGCLLCELCLGIAATFAAAAVPLMAIPIIPAALLLNRQLTATTSAHP